MIIIDYLYYQITNFYHHFEKDGTHKASGFIGVFALLFCNLIMTLAILDRFFNKNAMPANKYILLIYALPILLFIGFRYWKFTSYEEVQEKVKKFSKKKKIISDILLIIYIFISFPVFLVFCIYLGSLKN
ncbi:hypothetical protein CLU96_4317 [Chryseobacterium sp. 52]|uniref:hypothetical protein n=1 Tax=Chryseobacterium sp. 52 TaxID=2035213 RepID=UPI000C1A7916|nr:hypothetical protein [Chryseobacterium sp. 52]PIF47267.1 hypothetical protein CLU96_4317 [Chryseobacterium sp. 52]